MSSQKKETIYIDIDDEITTVIDKIRSADASIIAIVLPKRATMLQSRVNMKLLKKAADCAKKNIVLITAETSLLSLAGAVGVYVAKTLQSKPEIPVVKGLDVDDSVVTVDGSDQDDFDKAGAADTPIGALAEPDSDEQKTTPSSKVKPELTPLVIPMTGADPDESIEFDNSAEKDEAKDDEPSDKKGASNKDKKLKVPNFERFRLRLIIAAVLVIVLIVGFIFANMILPKASVTINTNTSTVNASLPVNLDTTASSVNTTQSIIPAQNQSVQETYSQQVPTTGQQNEGASATGTVTMSAQECNSITQPADVGPGVGLTANGLTFITQQDTSFTFSKIKNGCIFFTASGPTPITAQNPGASYNINPASFTVSGRPDVTATSANPTTGGTDNIIQIVSQADINNAQQKISTPDTTTVKAKLEATLQQAGLYPLTGTFAIGAPTTTNSSNVGDQATTVTVTEAITYTMFGIKKAYLQTLLDSNIDQQIDTSKQMIISDGLSNPTIAVVNQTATTAQLTVQATATAGPKLDLVSLKQQIAGKKEGDVKTIIGGNPGVTSVSVHYSPFWVNSTPSKVSKITITIKKSS